MIYSNKIELLSRRTAKTIEFTEEIESTKIELTSNNQLFRCNEIQSIKHSEMILKEYFHRDKCD